VVTSKSKDTKSKQSGDIQQAKNRPPAHFVCLLPFLTAVIKTMSSFLFTFITLFLISPRVQTQILVQEQIVAKSLGITAEELRSLRAFPLCV